MDPFTLLHGISYPLNLHLDIETHNHAMTLIPQTLKS
jgi:hypothetical protein